MSLQEICRFKIRQTMRDAIETDDPTYFKVKRDMSTFNKTRNRSTSSAAPKHADRAKKTTSQRQKYGNRRDNESNAQGHFGSTLLESIIRLSNECNHRSSG